MANAIYSITANAVNPGGIILRSVTGKYDRWCHQFHRPEPEHCSSKNTSNTNTMTVVRYLPNGSLDTSFNGTRLTTTAGPKPGDNCSYCGADYPASPSDKIVVGGSFWSANTEITGFALVRYNANGSLDTSFGTNGEVVTNIGNSGQSRISGVVVLPSGDIVAAGGTVNNGTAAFALACYTPAGVLDTTFKPGPGDPVAFTTPKGIVTTNFGNGSQRVSSFGDSRRWARKPIFWPRVTKLPPMTLLLMCWSATISTVAWIRHSAPTEW